MFSRNRFSEITDSLKSGFFADKVILTLARAKKRGRLEDDEKTIINDVLTFFSNVLEGFEWSDRPHFTMHSAESAEAFSKASRVLPNTTTSRSFKEYMENLVADAQNLNQSSTVDKGSVQRLIDFFTMYGQEELKRTDDLINPKDDIDSRSWMLTKALSDL
jgi:hypothetical protein